ncbi:MAG: PAS domain-containing protein [Balneolaceae bacterium]
MKNWKELLSECCKDEASCRKLEEKFLELEEDLEREKTFLRLLERSIRNDYDSILITDLEMEDPGPRIVYVNDGFTRITGYSRDEVIGKSPRILQGEKTDQAVLNRLRERLSSGQPFFGQAINYRKDGTEFVNQWDIHPLTNAKGEITHWVSYQHDITQRKRLERTLVDTQLEFDKLHEEVKSVRADLAPDGTILDANKAFRDLVGVPKEELIGRPVWEWIRDDQKENVSSLFATAGEEKFAAGRFHWTWCCLAGKEVETDVSSKWISSEEGGRIRIKLHNRSLQKRIIELLQRGQERERLLEKRSDYEYKIERENGEYLIQWISESFGHITGIPCSDVERTPLRDRVANEDWERVCDHLDRVCDGRQSTENYHIVCARRNPIPVVDVARPGTESIHGDVIYGVVSVESSDGAV